MSAELAFTAGWCGDFIACEEARVVGLTPRRRRSGAPAAHPPVPGGDRAGAGGDHRVRTGATRPYLMGTPRSTLRVWRTGPRLLGFSPDLRIGALGLELGVGYRVARAEGRVGQAPVIGFGLSVQPAL